MPFHSQGSYGFGKIYPLKAIEMTPGDKIKINLQSLTRSNALKYPTMANIRAEYHGFFVPWRILAHNFDNVNNLAIDESKRPSFPVLTAQQYLSLIASIGSSKLKSSLLDQLDYPVFAELYNFVLSTDDFQEHFDWTPSSSLDDNEYSIDFGPYFGVSGTSILQGIQSFHIFLYNSYPDAYKSLVESGKFSTMDVSDYDPELVVLSGSALASQLSSLVGKTSLALFDEYWNYIFNLVRVAYFQNMGESVGKPINTLSIWSYWRSVYDWYINTNIDQEVDTWEDWCVANFGCTIDTFDYTVFDGAGISYFERFITPAERLFSSDYFTSAFLSTQNGAAVPIPSGGTLIDLRSAESEQTFREKLLYSGKRVIDQIRTIFGVVSSDQRFDRAEILGSQKFTVNINSVSQTSQSTDVDNPLGASGGQGYGSGSRNNFIRYRAEEYGLVLIFMSYKPETIYSGVVDRLNLKTSPFDFLIPDFQNVGEQGIFQQELAYIPRENAADEIFGFNRRFAEYMFIQSSVHGAFRTTLKFQTLARSFTGKPVLNSEFIRINSKVNGLNDMFVASEEDEQFNNWTFFEVYCSRPLSRFIEYGF